MSNQLQAQEPSYPAFVRKLFNRSGDPSKDFAHATLGLVTEAHEYLVADERINGIEEMGDLEFYLEALSQVIESFLGFRLPMSDIEAEVDKDMMIFIMSARKPDLLQDTLVELLDRAKRWVGYGREPESLAATMSLALYAVRAVHTLGVLASEKYDRTHTISVNMAKLLKRYPGGDFDQFRALQRDLSAERATLETAVLG
jgi:hypothetical protein